MTIKKIRYINILRICFSLFAGTTISYAQLDSKMGLKIGLDVGEHLWTQSGSFQKGTGFAVGLFNLSGIRFLDDPPYSISLGFELNYAKINHYRLNDEFLYPYEFNLNRFVLDERFGLSFVELVLLPTVLHLVDEDKTIGFYAGPSAGIGKEHLTIHELSRVTVDTLNYQGAFYYPYGEYNLGSFRTTFGLNIGAQFWYHYVLIDVRYRITWMNEKSEVNSFQNFFVVVGLVL